LKKNLSNPPEAIGCEVVEPENDANQAGASEETDTANITASQARAMLRLTQLRRALEAACIENHELREISEVLGRRYQLALDELISSEKRRWGIRLKDLLLRSRSRLTPAEVRDVTDLRRSIHFDADWYLQKYPDVHERKADPALHYLRHGAQELRDPGPLFSTKQYIRNNPDVGTAGVNPLLHYERHGRSEGRTARDQLSLDFPASESEKHMPLSCVFVAEKLEAPGYGRVSQAMEAIAACGGAATSMPAGDLALRGEDLISQDIAIFHRVPWTDEVATAIAWLKAANRRVIFDTDELETEPDLAHLDVIDGIGARSRAKHYADLRRTMRAGDACTTTTEELAFHLRLAGMTTYVIADGFVRQTHERSRLEKRKRQNAGSDGLIRIGYAGDSDPDFAVAVPALARILREDPRCRLVLFKDQGRSLIDVAKLSDFDELREQIEWRNLVPEPELAREFARFDISLAPSQVGKAFGESQSEVKLWRAALVDVPTIASPTGPFIRAIHEDHTGFLAASGDDWYRQLQRLVNNPGLRRQVGHAAYHSALARFGPETRALHWGCILEELKGGAAAARGFALRSKLTTLASDLPKILPSQIIFEHDSGGISDVTVVVPLYNYQQYIEETLDSVHEQKIESLDLVIVDGCSSDNSLAVAETWARRHAQRFNRILVIRNEANYGLGYCRNCGVDASETPYVVLLDADNKLLPEACLEFAERLRQTGAAFAYSTLRSFGASTTLMGNASYSAQRLVPGNYIDALAAVSKEAWAMVGGIEHVPFGWEDYDLWCRFAEFGLRGEWIEQPLGLYRVHASSMQATQTKLAENLHRLMADFKARHPWTFLSDLERSRRHRLTSQN
jgi:GT2 family glycosyltransferase/glycosyltransferase involved in cell wall biosynthesis